MQLCLKAAIIPDLSCPMSATCNLHGSRKGKMQPCGGICFPRPALLIGRPTCREGARAQGTLRPMQHLQEIYEPHLQGQWAVHWDMSLAASLSQESRKSQMCIPARTRRGAARSVIQMRAVRSADALAK